MRRWLFAASLLLLAPLSRAQNPTLQGWCESGAQPVVTSGLTSSTQVQQSFPACTITVFVHGGGLATIFADSSNTPLSNPFTAQSNGRWIFYVAPGRYDVQLSGAGFPSPVTYLDLLTATGGAGTSPGGIPIQTQVNSSGSFGGTSCQSFGNISTGPINLGCNVSQSLSANVSLKHLTNNIVQYVSAFGSDANDGLSWGTAKKTIFAALEALPGGSSSAPATAGKGTVYVTDGGGTCAGLASDGVTNNSVQAGLNNPFSTSGTGIWIMGPSDPNYASPPTGWLHFSGPFSVIGVAGSCNPAQSRQAMMVDVASGAVGSNWQAASPAVWISGISGTIRFENIAFVSAVNAVRLGITSNGTRTGTGAQGITFKNVSGITGQFSASEGPTVDIGANVFWVWFEGCTFSANVSASVSTDQRANMVINAAGGANTGLITIKDNVWNGGGGTKLYAANTITSLWIDGLTIEGSSGHGQPALWLPTLGNQAFNTEVNVRNAILSDYTDPVSVVQIDGQISPTSVQVSNSEGGAGAPLIAGPAIIASTGAAQAIRTQVASPALYDQVGFIAGDGGSPARVYGQQDTSRRGFSPVIARFAQIAPQLPSAWTNGLGSPTINTGIAAPDGTTNAGRVSATGISSVNFLSTSHAVAVGDWVIAGIWARSNTTNGFAGSPSPANVTISTVTSVQLQGFPTATTGAPLYQVIKGDGEWGWYYQAFKILAISSSPGSLLFFGNADSTHTADFYAPILLYIPNGTISDNEASELALHLATYPETAGPGEVSMLRNQYLRLGSTAFASLGTPANGVFIYCSDCTVANPCANGGTGALAKRLNGAWVCN